MKIILIILLLISTEVKSQKIDSTTWFEFQHRYYERLIDSAQRVYSQNPARLFLDRMADSSAKYSQLDTEMILRGWARKPDPVIHTITL